MGRRGGINILHQKSWHVWRMDNRLIVERDELQHAAAEGERIVAEQQATFTGRLALLRRRASGAEEEDPPPPGAPMLTSSSSSSSSALPSSVMPAAGSGKTASTKKEKDKKDSYRFGAVELSNLKQAERDLDNSIKNRRTKDGGSSAGGRGKTLKEGPPVAGTGYWGLGGGGLGSGPHINLFEGAELEVDSHRAQHQKQIQYTERNNELVEKSKKRPLSEFDEIADNIPWYARAPTPSSEAAEHAEEGAAPEAPSGAAAPRTRQRWSQSHGQAVLRVESVRIASVQEAEEGSKAIDEKTEAQKTLPDWGVVDCCAITSGSSDSSSDVVKTRKHKAKKGKKEKKEKKQKSKKESKEERAARRHQELQQLRQQREAREREERGRASRLASGRGGLGVGLGGGRALWGPSSSAAVAAR